MSKPKFKVGDKVKILDGSNIRNYTGGFVDDMRNEVGNVYTIETVNDNKYEGSSYYLKEVMYKWDERGLELVKSVPNWKVVIVPDGDTTVAKFYENDKIVKEVTTKKSIDDEYDWKEAVKVVCDRLCKDAEYAKDVKDEPVKLYNGRVFCVDSGECDHLYTTGKIYEFKDGQITCDQGHRFPWIPVTNISTFITGSGATWMEVVD